MAWWLAGERGNWWENKNTIKNLKRIWKDVIININIQIMIEKKKKNIYIYIYLEMPREYITIYYWYWNIMFQWPNRIGYGIIFKTLVGGGW